MKSNHYGGTSEDFEAVFDEVQNILHEYTQQSTTAETTRFNRISTRVSMQESRPGVRRRKRNKRKHVRISRLLMVLFMLILVVSLGKFSITWFQLKKEQAAFEQLAEQVSEAARQYSQESLNPIFQADSPTSTVQPETNAYQILYDQNPDFVGWLQIKDTIIDYPVMYTPDNPEYYLRRAFDGSKSESGTLFVGDDGGINDDLFIIYGHNMDNDTMFGTLDQYADPSFYQDNPTFTFTTVSETRQYEVFAAIKTRVMYTSESGYRYYDQAGELDEEEFSQLINWLQTNALYQTGIVPTYGEQIVILSTCSYHTDNGRFIVAARRIPNKPNDE